ncbi:MAG: transketolase [Patescibacteria group bacterium]|jgi:transketolase
MTDFDKLKKLCQLIRYDILTSTTAAKSGHPSTALSAVELMTTLFFACPPAGGFFYSDLKNPKDFNNDRLIFSKGHASPLFYSLYHATGAVSYEELMTMRKFASPLEGHATPRFAFADVATGSLGQGLSIGIGMALGIKLRIANNELRIKREPKVFVLLGDSETAEGQVWEALEIGSLYKLNNVVAILDVNRLGQNGETMIGWDLETYAKRVGSFGWETIVVDDGHDLNKVFKAFEKATSSIDKPVMIIAKTIKGKGVSFIENKDGWHGKPLPKDMLESALKELGEVDLKITGKVTLPQYQISNIKDQKDKLKIKNVFNFKLGDQIATRETYGDALVALGETNKNIVVLDAEVGNSTYANKFQKVFPDRFFQLFIAEQNMVSVALGLEKIGFVPFAATFSAFLTRAFDQIRMSQYSDGNIKITGSHAGVSIGEDGPSQMGLEDISMMRSLLNSIVFYPSDAVSTAELIRIMADKKGIFYLRTTRGKAPVIYNQNEEFKIGGSKIHKPVGVGRRPSALIIAAGVTLHEALKAQTELAKSGIETVVLDCYSVKPLDVRSINQLAKEARNIIVVEDHYPAGGIGEAVTDLIVNSKLKIENYTHLCVKKIAFSGTPEELLHFEKIDAKAIVKAVKKLS